MHITNLSRSYFISLNLRSFFSSFKLLNTSRLRSINQKLKCSRDIIHISRSWGGKKKKKIASHLKCKLSGLHYKSELHSQLCDLNILQLTNAILFSVAVQSAEIDLLNEDPFRTTAICWFWSFVMWFFGYKYNQMHVNAKFIRIQCFRNGVANCIREMVSEISKSIQTLNFQFNRSVCTYIVVYAILKYRIYLKHLFRIIWENSATNKLLVLIVAKN